MTQENCIFCDIVAGKASCHRVWEDEKHLAFLSIFPNTLGVTVVIPKRHHPSYLFSLPDDVIKELVIAAKSVAALLDETFADVSVTGMVFEGLGVNHVHAKLFPLHGTKREGDWAPVKSALKKYFDKYEGYISSHDHERESDQVLAALAAKISAASGHR